MIISALILLVVVVIITSGHSEGKTWYVDDSGGQDHRTIQGAIDDAQEGDSVYVHRGTYVEQVIVDKSIDLIGENNETTVIQGEGKDDVVIITADHVNMTNFRVIGDGSFGYDASQILVRSNYSRVSNNRCSNNIYGVMLYEASHNIIENNVCFDDYMGISVVDSSWNLIANNTCYSNSHSGISIHYSSNNVIRNNICRENRYGIEVEYISYDNDLENNQCLYNDDGIIINSNYHPNNLTGNRLVSNGIMIDLFRPDGVHYRIDPSNTVNGRPIYYYEHTTGEIIPAGAGQIILINCTNMVVQSQNLMNSTNGMQISFSSWISICDTNCNDNSASGILLYESDNITLTDVQCNRNTNGISIEDSNDIFINSSEISNNDENGILLHSSNRVSLNGNQLDENGLMIEGLRESWDTHTIPTTNEVNGRPLYYYKDMQGITVPKSAGQIILANCSEILIEDQKLSDCTVGILVGYSSNITILNCTSSRNDYGIYLKQTPFSLIENNIAKLNTKSGILIQRSDNVRLLDNECSENGGGKGGGYHFFESGIELVYTTNCTIRNNRCFDNEKYGISMDDCSDNGLSSNYCSNMWYGIALYGGENNTLNNNTLTSHGNYGIKLSGSDYNKITGNYIQNNRIGIHVRQGSSNNSIHFNNILDNEEFGIEVRPDNDGITIDASKNYWGSPSGPYHSENNSEGKGEEITDDVAFEPWLGFDIDSNDQPTASIVSINPNPGVIGNTVTFIGSGTDNGTIEYYSWRSDIDGQLYSGPSLFFFIHNLSLGDHTIYLKVRDDFEVWSEETSMFFQVTPGPMENQVPMVFIISPANGSEVTDSISIIGAVFDHDDENTITKVSIEEGEWFVISNDTVWEFELDTTVFEDGSLEMQFRAFDGKNHSEIVSFRIIIDNESDEDGSPIFPTPGLLIIGIVVIGLWGMAYGHEKVRYVLFSVFTIPLYTKLEKDEIMDHPNRRRICMYLRKNPGSNYTKLLHKLGMGNGTLVHHLNILESQGYVRSRTQYGRKQFSIKEIGWNPTKGNDELPVSPQQKEIINFLKNNEGATRVEIEDSLPISSRTLRHSIKALREKGLITIGGGGRGARYTLPNRNTGEN